MTDPILFRRPDGRGNLEVRPVRISPSVNPHAEGSVEVSFGKTKVLCTASIEPESPRWMVEENRGWITAEYGMLPRSTHTRTRREAASGKQGGRTLEIQRLIGRSLRRAVDLFSLGPITVRLDCDVLVADGGTRTAAISGSWVALFQALRWAEENGVIREFPEVQHVVALSVGSVEGVHLVDLCYEEDSIADFDLNLVFNEHRKIIEIQGTGEQGELEVKELNSLVLLGAEAAESVLAAQKQAVARLTEGVG